jgi:hypothetical protein
MKKYRELNDESIKLEKSEVHQCECGANYSHSNKSRHLKSKQHREYSRLTKLKQCLVDG